MFLVPLDSARHRDPGHPHRRRRPHQHRLLQRCPGRRQVPPRRGQRRLDGAARTAQRRARRRRRRGRRAAGRLDHDAPGRVHGRPPCDKAAADGRHRRTRTVAGRSTTGRSPTGSGRSIARMEASLSHARASSAGSRWRRPCATSSPDLMDILGAASALPIGTDGAADDGAAEYVYRFAPLVGIYGGHARGVPQHDRPVRARPRQAELLSAQEGVVTIRVVQWTTGNVGRQSVDADRRPPRPRAGRLLRVVARQGRSSTSVSCAASPPPASAPPTTSTRCWR